MELNPEAKNNVKRILLTLTTILLLGIVIPVSYILLILYSHEFVGPIFLLPVLDIPISVLFLILFAFVLFITWLIYGRKNYKLWVIGLIIGCLILLFTQSYVSSRIHFLSKYPLPMKLILPILYKNSPCGSPLEPQTVAPCPDNW